MKGYMKPDHINNLEYSLDTFRDLYAVCVLSRWLRDPETVEIFPGNKEITVKHDKTSLAYRFGIKAVKVSWDVRTEVARLSWLRKGKGDHKYNYEHDPETDIIPFDSKIKYSRNDVDIPWPDHYTDAINLIVSAIQEYWKFGVKVR